jgi:hypothetical protein
MEYDTGCDPIAADHLDHVACRDGNALDCFQDKEAVSGSLGVTDRYGFGVKARAGRGDEQRARQNKQRTGAGKQSWHEPLPLLSAIN